MIMPAPISRYPFIANQPPACLLIISRIIHMHVRTWPCESSCLHVEKSGPLAAHTSTSSHCMKGVYAHNICYFIVILPACPPLLTTCDIVAGLVDIKPSSSARTHCPDVASDMSSRLLFDQTARRAGVDKNLEVAGLDFAHVRLLLFCPIGRISTSRAAESFWPLLSRYILSS